MLDNITALIKCSKGSDEEAEKAKEKLFSIFYDELHKIAKIHMKFEPSNHTLQPTALIHEAYIRFIKNGVYEGLANRIHFFATASRIMRHVLVDSARARRSQKRGRGEQTVVINEEIDGQPRNSVEPIDLIALDLALNELEKVNKLRSDIVDMRIFGGLQHEEIATVLGIETIKAKAQWNLARKWLREKLQNINA